MSEDVSLEEKRVMVEMWVTSLHSYLRHKAIENELKLGKDAFYKYKYNNRTFPDIEIEKMYNFLKKKALIRTNDFQDEEDEKD